MEVLQNDRLVHFIPGQMVAVRKLFGLDNENRMEEAIDVLDMWIQKQNHFVKKDFDRGYLERLIISKKGSVEQAKKAIDKLFTLRTLMPEFFDKPDYKNNYKEMMMCYENAVLPKPTNDYYRVIVNKVLNNNYNSSCIMDFFKFGVTVGEYLKLHDYVSGFILVFDYREMNIMDLIGKLNPMDLQKAYILLTAHHLSRWADECGGVMLFVADKHWDASDYPFWGLCRDDMYILKEGYGMRIKGIHLLTPSKVIETLMSIIKPVLSTKVSNRMYIHKDIESLHKHISHDILPSDLGGKEISMKKLHETCVDVLGSEKHVQYLKDLNSCGTNESCRQKEKFNEQYLGMPGTFRTLSVD